MVSGINPVRRFPTVSGHYSPTVARRPSGRLTSAFAWIRPLLRAGSATSRWSVPDNTPAPTGIRRSRERNRTRRRFGQWNGGFHHYRAPFRHSTPGAASAITDSCSELLFPDVFSGDASAIPYPPGGTRRTLFGAPPRVDPAFFRSGRGGSSWCQRLRGGPAAPQGRRQDRRSGCAAACLL